MDAETDVKPEERKGSFLGIIVMVFLGLWAWCSLVLADSPGSL